MNGVESETFSPQGTRSRNLFRRHPGYVRIIILIAICIGLLLGLSALILKLSPYPELDAFTALPCSTRVYDCSGKLLQILPLENGLRRERISLKDIPDTVKQAFILSEDRRFYSHNGVDAGAVIRALFQNLSAGKTVSGGSTITMQLARLITPREKRNLAAKCAEAWNALRLESRLSKEEILELYLNHIYFGYNTEGVASAARTFFAKEISSLSPEEACLLSVIPRSPSQYSPLSHPESCAEAAVSVYTGIFKDDNDSSPNTAGSTVYETLYAAASHAKRFTYPYEMPHYIRFLTELSNQNINSPESSSMLSEGVIGVHLYYDDEVHLSASLEVQELAQNELSRMLSTYSQNRLSNGAVLAFDTQTGEIIAWIGSGDFSSDETEGQIDGVLTPNQPGSSMKPFLYALALDSGWSPAAILPDIPHDFGADELYIPQNFNNRYNGPVTLRVALASSLNMPAVWLLNRLGLTNYKDKLKSLSFDSLDSQDPGLSLALGGAEVTLLELTRAFSIFSRDGNFIPLKATSETAGDSIQIYDKNTARLIADILSDEQARALGFGYASVFETPFSAIFKTGTANQYQNITALASTPLYTVGVWMGNFTGETIIGKTGSSLPASIAKEVLCFLQGMEDIPFSKPEQYQLERICSLSGMKAGPDCPNTRLEYLPSGSSSATCSWHTSEGVFYPEEYQAWLSIKNRTGTVTYTGNPLTIETPRDGSVFFHDDSALGRNQGISVSVTGGTNSTLSYVLKESSSDKVISSGTISRPFNFMLPVEKGKYMLSVRTDTEDESIQFTVN